MPERSFDLPSCPSCNLALEEAAFDRCPACGYLLDGDLNLATSQPPFLSLPQLRYQTAYTWLVLLAALDIMLTMLVLYVWRGYEVNPIAAAVIVERGFVWAIVLKFCVVVAVVIICEVIGRRDDRSGTTLAIGAVVLNAIPVAHTFALLLNAGPPT
jgi:hypothetical protein